jgi:hypothetical protein
MGKGDTPRNVGPKFKANFSDIDWQRDDAPLFKCTSTRRIYRYGKRSVSTSPAPPLDSDFRVQDPGPRTPFPDPTPEMRTTPEFEAVWQCIKRWDINVPGAYVGYTGAMGNHVRAILDALTEAHCLVPREIISFKKSLYDR